MPMTFNQQEPEQERRYDPETLRKVTALAARLQSEHHENLTVQEIESIGAEIGLESTFIHRAIAQLEHHSSARETEQESLEAHGVTDRAAEGFTEPTVHSPEFIAALTALAFPLAWGSLAYAFRTASPDILTLFTVLTPGPLAALIGFLTGKQSVARLASSSLMLSLAPSFAYLMNSDHASGQIDAGAMMSSVMVYAMFGIPVASWLSTYGATLRDRYFPFRASKADEQATISKPEMLTMLSNIQEDISSRRVRRTFLSVEIAGPSEMRASGPELTVQHAFAQLHRWTDEIVESYGGALHSASGDQRTFLFPTDTAAIRAARRLQDGISGFNLALNRLSMPFRLRCGICSGEVAKGATVAGAPLHCPEIDRATQLQQRAEPGDIVVSGESAASGLVELGTLAPLPEHQFGPAAFSWKSGQSTAGSFAAQQAAS